ncbi:MAG TPA: acyl-CoA dehydrogenase family protein [Burkholderiales bacterium]|nr:acyl-CoA dehydrogenase family protein [Burkholderiales bacterium]
MFDLRLSPEQLEIRDTVRDFVAKEIKPAALRPERLEPFAKPLLAAQLGQASRLGLRTLTLSEESGGAGADALTCCIVTEELAAGDPDIAAVLAHTAMLARLLERAMTPEQRGRLLRPFVQDDAFHLALAQGDAARSGSDYVLDGTAAAVANATVAKLFLVRVEAGTLLVPRDASGVSVREQAGDWYHGSCGEVRFANCRVPAANLAGPVGNIAPLNPALSLGIGRAAYEAALDYARIRVQGGKPIIGHQAIAAKLAGIAIGLEVARGAVWRAAWASDHPEAVADRSIPDLPLQSIAEAFAPEVMLRAVKDAAECFGAMGVMRDMPLHKYVHDARVCLHSGDGSSGARLQVAAAITE